MQPRSVDSCSGWSPQALCGFMDANPCLDAERISSRRTGEAGSSVMCCWINRRLNERTSLASGTFVLSPRKFCQPRAHATRGRESWKPRDVL